MYLAHGPLIQTLICVPVVLCAATAGPQRPDAAPKDTCNRSKALVKDWSLLQISTNTPVLSKASQRLEHEKVTKHAPGVEGAVLAEMVKPGRPPRHCCLAMIAACLACAEGVSVEDYCADPRHAGVPDCTEALVPVPAPTGEQAVATMPPEPQPSPGPTPSPKAVHGTCCRAMMASCLACQIGMSIEDYCANPLHFGVSGCGTPSTTLASAQAGQGNSSAGTGCAFEIEPVTPYFWDESCNPHGLGCFADGIHGPCRFCGEGAYASISCPGCTFPGKAPGLHYWDNACRVDPRLPGCLADGVHPECRFCGEGQYEEVQCPASVVPTTGRCVFRDEPSMPHYWDPACKRGIVGCWADGVHAECRWCGEGPYENILCPE
mmetsp:Transcript_77208/g.226444  ORF Transcript_77208/g.226444 Transcript_77208/m.226444 type:complete len:377 (-) Transcript_77208:362-1492(-)